MSEVVANSDDLRALARRARDTQHSLDDVWADSERQLRDLDRRGWSSGDVDGPMGTARGLVREVGSILASTQSTLDNKAQILDELSDRRFPDGASVGQPLMGLGFPVFPLPNPFGALQLAGDGARWLFGQGEQAFEHGEQLFDQAMGQLQATSVEMAREIDAQLDLLYQEAQSLERSAIREIDTIENAVVDEAQLLEHQAINALQSAEHEVATVLVPAFLGEIRDGLIVLTLPALTEFASLRPGRALQVLDQAAALYGRVIMGESPQEAALRTLDGQRSECHHPLEQRRAQPGAVTNLFVSGITTDDLEDPHGTFQHYEDDIENNHREMGYEEYDWGQNDPGLPGVLYASTSVSVTASAERLEDQLKDMKAAGETNIVLTGHSKGGALIMEYMAEVAEGKRRMLYDEQGRPLVSKVVVMDSPLNGGTTGPWDPGKVTGLDQAESDFVGFERYGPGGEDRIAHAVSVFKGKNKVDFRVYDNPDDPVSSPGTSEITRSEPLPKPDNEAPISLSNLLPVHGRVVSDTSIMTNYFKFIQE